MSAVGPMQAAGHDKPHGTGSIVPALAKNARTGHPLFRIGKEKHGKPGHPPSGQSSGSGSTSWGETFNIDPWGNLIGRTGITGKAYYQALVGVTANPKNQLSGYCYDAAGNLILNAACPHGILTPTYTYDAENRLIATAGYSYIYDADGQRVEKCQEGATPGTCATGTTTGTLYWRGAGADPLTETDLAGSLQNHYIYFNGERVARLDSAQAVHYYFSDHLGSHGLIENATGTACEQDIDYYPYGAEEYDNCGTPVAQNYKFTGKERDVESGLDNFGARYNDSGLGRFMTPDWAAKPVTVPYANFGDPQSLNLYIYVENAPLSRIDAVGHAEYQRGNGGGWDASGLESAELTTGVEDDDQAQAVAAANTTPSAKPAQNTAPQQASQTTSNSSTSTSTDRVATALSNVPGVASVTPAPDPARDKAIGGHQNETDALTFKTPEDQAKFLAESSRKHTIPGDVSENGFGPGVRLPGGLHAEQGRVDPSTGQFLVTSHIDRFNPNNGLGPMVGHAVVDVFIGTIFFHHTAGLDQ
jgi:RHS repeat-associated protein